MSSSGTRVRRRTVIWMCVGLLGLVALGSALVSAGPTTKAPPSAVRNPTGDPAKQGQPPGLTSKPVYVVATYDVRALQIWADDHVVATKPASGPVDVKRVPMEIGSYVGDNRWKGRIQEVALYDRALTPGQIAEHFRLGLTSAPRYERAVRTTPGLVAAWPLGERTGKDASDLLDKHPATYFGGESRGVSGMLGGNDTATALDGENGGIRVRDAAALNPRDGFSLEAWVSTSDAANRTVVGKASAWFLKVDLLGGWTAGFYSNGKLRSVGAKIGPPAAPAAATAAPTGATNTAPPTGGS